jgi:hypothetical protein
MRRPHRWQNDLFSEGFSVGPLAFSNAIEGRLRKKVPFTHFLKRMNEEMVPLNPPLPPRTMAWLYEAGLHARVEQDTVSYALRLLPKGLRNKKQQSVGTYELLTLLHKIRNAPYIKKQAAVKTKADRLAKDLAKLICLYRSWRQYADWGSFRPDYKSRLTLIERILNKKHSDILKLKYQRIGVIRAMLIAIGLKIDIDDDAIARMLRPSRVSKRHKSRSA